MRVNIRRLAGNLGVRPIQVRAALRLLQAGHTVPYLAYYARSRTGGLSEMALRHIARYLEEQKRLAERKQSVLKHIEGQDCLTEELRESILLAEDAPQLEELFFPFKQPQETPADQAHAQGLSKLAEAVWTNDPVAEHLPDLLPTFVNPDIGLNTPEDVLEGVRHLLAERLAQLWRWRRVGRRVLRETAVLVARRHPQLPEREGQEFRDFFQFREPIRRIRPYLLLTLVRGEREHVLQLDIEFDQEKVRQTLLEHFPIREHRHLELIRSAADEAIELYLIPALVGELRRKLHQRAEDYAAEVIGESLRRLALVRLMPGYRVLAIDPALRPGCRVAVLDESGTVLECRLLHLLGWSRSERTQREQSKATPVEARQAQAHHAVSSANGDSGSADAQTAGNANVSPSRGSDGTHSSAASAANSGGASERPATGQEVNQEGHAPPTSASPSQADSQSATQPVEIPAAHVSEASTDTARTLPGDVEQLCELVRRHEVQVIVIGNNNHCREVERLVRDLIAERLPDVQYSIVTDLGAAQYAGGMLGREELPNLDAGLRLAVSLGRRFQDLLAELVKVDVVSLAGLLNFFDISVRRAQEAVRHALESLVNWVGVDLNQASVSQLRYVAGLNEHLARVLVDYRRTAGPFRRREQLLQVPGITPAIYRQSAAFLRIADGDEPLDSTWLHPDQYDLARRLLQALGFSPDAVREPFRRRELRRILSQADVNRLAEELDCSALALREVMNHLAAAGRDPRWLFPEPILRTRTRPLSELRVGEQYTGLVVKLLDFGAFVDIGAEETGLVHRSRMGRSKFHSPREVLTVGEVVTVWVVQVDAAQKRIALSLVPPMAGRRRSVRRRRAVKPSPPVTMAVQSPAGRTVSTTPAAEATTTPSPTAPVRPSESVESAPAVEPAPAPLPIHPGELTPAAPAVAAPGLVVASVASSETSPSTVAAPLASERAAPAATPPAVTAETQTLTDSGPKPPRKPKPKPPLRAVHEPPAPSPGILSGKRELRTFAELKAFFEARQRLRASSPSATEQAPANPTPHNAES